MTEQISRAGQNNQIVELCKKSSRKLSQPFRAIQVKLLWLVAQMPEYMQPVK
jgi:hypothetical protein